MLKITMIKVQCDCGVETEITIKPARTIQAEQDYSVPEFRALISLEYKCASCEKYNTIPINYVPEK